MKRMKRVVAIAAAAAMTASVMTGCGKSGGNEPAANHGGASGEDELDAESLQQATLMEHQFIPEEWGGANELHRIAGEKIGVLSHIAGFDTEGNRHYYSTAFCFNPETGEYGPMKMIAERRNFQPGPSKRPDLEDVIFSGGLVRLGGGKAELYCGVSDAEGQKVLIDDPFDEYENR